MSRTDLILVRQAPATSLSNSPTGIYCVVEYNSSIGAPHRYQIQDFLASFYGDLTLDPNKMYWGNFNTIVVFADVAMLPAYATPNNVSRDARLVTPNPTTYLFVEVGDVIEYILANSNYNAEVLGMTTDGRYAVSAACASVAGAIDPNYVVKILVPANASSEDTAICVKVLKANSSADSMEPFTSVDAKLTREEIKEAGLTGTAGQALLAKVNSLMKDKGGSWDMCVVTVGRSVLHAKLVKDEQELVNVTNRLHLIEG